MTRYTNQPNHSEEVFFLGAGASVSGGAPTFANFRDKATAALLKISGSNSNRDLFQDVLNQWDKNYSDYNIEEYYSAVEMDELLDEGHESITTDEIVRFIALTIKKSMAASSTRPYELLASYLGGKTIITTNWDILLELSIKKSRETYDFSINYGKMAEPFHEATSQSEGPCILKLHGSLNWGFCKECDQIYYFDRKISEELASKNGKNCKKHPTVRLTPLIVPPTLSKLESAEQRTEKSPYVPLRSIWSKASRCLRLCEKVYFIGYSFPETDVQMKIFISNALRRNENLKAIPSPSTNINTADFRYPIKYLLN